MVFDIVVFTPAAYGILLAFIDYELKAGSSFGFYSIWFLPDHAKGMEQEPQSFWRKMKQLFLCRHAKSSWKDLSLDDIDRPLNKRGKRDAPVMGQRLLGYGVSPDAVLSSPARRARKTAKHICRELGFSKERITIVPELYGATPDGLLRVIQCLGDRESKVIMVGHNPETTDLANLLANLTIFNVPTCGVVALDFAVGRWREVEYGLGVQSFYEYPKKGGAFVA